MTVNSRTRAEKHKKRMRGRKSEDQEGAERMSEGRDTEIRRDRERKKNKCKPLRINSLISLWGRMEKKRISTSYPLSLPLISLSLSLSVSYSNIFSLYSSCWNRLAELAKAWTHMANLGGQKSPSVALFLPPFRLLLQLLNFSWSLHFC